MCIILKNELGRTLLSPLNTFIMCFQFPETFWNASLVISGLRSFCSPKIDIEK